MEFQDLVAVVEMATVIVTFIMMGSGMPVCVHMYKQKTTQNVPYLLFLISALVSTLSLQYGILISNKVLIFINVVALLVWGAYISTFVLVSKSKASPMLQLLAVAGVYWAHAYYLQILPSSDVIPTLGKYLIVWCTIAYVIPAKDIWTMVQEKSAQCCDLPLLCGGTLSASVWYLYGVLVNDINIYFPSIPALLVSLIKFGMMFVYGRASKSTPETVTAKEGKGLKADFHEDIYKTPKTREGLRQRI